MIVLLIESRFDTSTNTNLNFKCVHIITNILDIYAVGRHPHCQLPLGYVFTSNLLKTCQEEASTHINDLITSCISTVKVVVQYVGKNDDTASDICTSLLTSLSDERKQLQEYVIIIIDKILAEFSQVLKETTIKSRTEQNIYRIVSMLSEQLLSTLSAHAHMSDGEKGADDGHWVSIFAHLCQITQQAQVRK